MNEKLYLHVPDVDEMWYRRRIMMDPATMEYNKGMDACEGYEPETGCVNFPQSQWQGFCDRFVDNEPERFFAFIARRADLEFVGQVSLEKKDVYTEIWNDCCIMYQNGGWQPAQVIPKLIFTSDESDAITEIQSNLKTYVEENVAAFLTGAKSLETDWDAYVAELDKIGLADYLEVVQTVYDRMY